MRGVDPNQLEKASRDLGAAALDPTLWPEAMEGICRATGTTGAALLQSDVRTPDVPRTAGIEELFTTYFSEGWHLRDLRVRGVPLWMAGEPVVIEHDIVDPGEKAAKFFLNEFLLRHGFQWFAGVGFSAGRSLWVLALQRTPAEGAFAQADKQSLAELSPLLTEVATLSTAVGRTVISGIANALESVHRPALVLDRMGFALGTNAAAQALFDDDVRVRNRRLAIQDQTARAALETLIDQLRITPDQPGFPAMSIVARRRIGAAIVIRAMPIPPAARGPFLGARALLTFSVLEPSPAPEPGIIMQAFGLTQAEARLASLIAGGTAPAEAARRLGIARETARNQLKAIFAKTETHRQGELVALLARLAC